MILPKYERGDIVLDRKFEFEHEIIGIFRQRASYEGQKDKIFYVIRQYFSMNSKSKIGAIQMLEEKDLLSRGEFYSELEQLGITPLI